MTARFRTKTIANATVAASVLSAVLATGGAAVAAAAVPAEARAAGQTAAPQAPAASPATGQAAGAPSGPAGVVPPSDYVIGAEDKLSVRFWRDKDMSTDVVVRPDGKITLPLLNEIVAAGLTPAQLRDRLTEESKKYIEDPNLSVVVLEINSRRVFITGEVGKPGSYSLVAPTTVLQLIAMAGGLKDFADSDNILIISNEKGRPIRYRFSYKAIASKKKTSLDANIELKAGDTIIVP